MAKSKKFQSDAEGPISVATPSNASSVRFEPGETVEVDDPAVIEALEANPDVSEAKESRSSSSGKKR